MKRSAQVQSDPVSPTPKAHAQQLFELWKQSQQKGIEFYWSFADDERSRILEAAEASTSLKFWMRNEREIVNKLAFLEESNKIITSMNKGCEPVNTAINQKLKQTTCLKDLCKLGGIVLTVILLLLLIPLNTKISSAEIIFLSPDITHNLKELSCNVPFNSSLFTLKLV